MPEGVSIIQSYGNMAIFRQLLSDVRCVCQQIIAIVCGLELT